MKKIISIILAIAMTVSLTACGGKDKETEKASQAATSAGETTPSDGYNKGAITPTEFTSDYLKMKFTVPEGYQMITGSRLLDLSNFGGDPIYIDEAKTQPDYSKAINICEFACEESSILIPEIELFVNKLKKPMTATEYAETIVGESGLDKNATGFGMKHEQITVAGEVYEAYTSTIHDSGNTFHQEYLFRIYGERAVCIVVLYTNTMEEQRDMLLNCFSAM